MVSYELHYFFLFHANSVKTNFGIKIKENRCTNRRIQRLRCADQNTKRIADLRFLLLQPFRSTKGTHFDPRGNISFPDRYRLPSNQGRHLHTAYIILVQCIEACTGQKVKYRERTYKSMRPALSFQYFSAHTL